jgi:hypothetical protein
VFSKHDNCSFDRDHFFGLKLNGFSFSSGVNWIADPPGIRLSKYGIVYTDPFIEYSGDDNSSPNGFSVEIALRPANFLERGFNIIMDIHSGKEINNLLFVQVHSRLYLMSGGDYDVKRNTKRIRVKLDTPSPTTQFITITTGKNGSAVYLNGQLVRTKKNLTLQIPNGRKARLFLGNSVYS